MQFLIWETLSFNLMYVAACYPVGTTISKTSPLFTALLQHYVDFCWIPEHLFLGCYICSVCLCFLTYEVDENKMENVRYLFIVQATD